MNFYKKDIHNVRGDTYSFGLISDEELDTIYFTCRDALNDDSNILFQKSLNNGITLTEQEEEYSYSIRVAPNDTKSLQSGIYYYDLQIELNEDVFTVMKGKFIVEQDSTWEVE